MKYKVGDVVRLRSDLVDGEEYGCNVFVLEMEGYKGKPLKIVDVYKIGYEVEVDDEVREYNITDEMIAGYWDMFADEENVGMTIFNSLNNNDNFPKKLKLIDILNKIANGELKEGTKVIIDNKTFVYGYQNHIKVFSNEIRNEYLDVLQCLGDEVELIEPHQFREDTKMIEPTECEHEWEMITFENLSGIEGTYRRCAKCNTYEKCGQKYLGRTNKTIEPTDNAKIEELNPNNYLIFVDYDKDGNEEYKLEANLAIMGDCSRGIKGIISKLNEVIRKINKGE